jgi:DNA-directed RNA polymerase specialized sigma24 family protein
VRAKVQTAARTHALDDAAAWGAVQEAFLTALEGRGPTRGGHPVGWLCGVARNHARNELRRRGRFEGFLVRLAVRRSHRLAGAGRAPRLVWARENGGWRGLRHPVEPAAENGSNDA